MVFQGSSAAISHTGKVRSNNQDSGYAGSNLFVVADGMGGHAGGDVASSLAIARLQSLDRPYGTTAEAERELRDAIGDAATQLIDTVHDRPELAGMGTTVSALVMVDDYAASHFPGATTAVDEFIAEYPPKLALAGQTGGMLLLY